MKGQKFYKHMEGNVLYSGQWKSAQTERELSVETKTVWVLESSPEGICNHLSSITVRFFFFFFFSNFNVVDLYKQRVCLLSSQRPGVALYFLVS